MYTTAKKSSDKPANIRFGTVAAGHYQPQQQLVTQLQLLAYKTQYSVTTPSPPDQR